jgi:hypothetical protein
MKTFLIAALLACAATAHAQPADQERSQIFPRSDYCRQTGALDGGYFCEAWRTGHDEDPDELVGYVFLKTIDYGGTKMRVLVGVFPNGEISKVMVNGPEAIDQEFLKQFEGKNLRSSFEIARTLDDLLFVPAKIKAMAGKTELSQTIAETVAKLMKLAGSSQKLSLAK